MENQDQKRDGLNQNQSQKENQWSQKNESQHQDQDTDQSNSTPRGMNSEDAGAQHRPDQMQNNNAGQSNSQPYQGSNPTDGRFSQSGNMDRSQINNMDQQREGSDADYAASGPGTQNIKRETLEDPNTNANIENRNDQHGEGSLDQDDLEENMPKDI